MVDLIYCPLLILTFASICTMSLILHRSRYTDKVLENSLHNARSVICILLGLSIALMIDAFIASHPIILTSYSISTIVSVFFLKWINYTLRKLENRAENHEEAAVDNLA
ncbi:hypothetical protein GCK72_009089 [Caenorhabditis remanei]|uniref:Uncharacterized protein n=1 Tax=Caenorhabditis remanei TaxID=31234 RepID=A0A6A5H1E1_CAERE|nr:hypothetical protein GCK72_009089 [Caenorhabditis remanei]KAF1760839.1 hypothetical protein GCK72_009089 [Caenorhabditis remanei]